MKKIPLSGMLLFALLNSAYAQDSVAPSAMENGNFCLFAGTPPAEFKYTVVRTLKLGRETYGGVKDVLPAFVAAGRAAGADAIIDYAGSQRFGFFPWRVIRPVLRGTAVKWDSKVAVDCEKMGGMTMSAIIATNKAPQKGQGNAPEKAPEMAPEAAPEK